MTLTKYQSRINNATWIDVNPQFSTNLQPERLADEQSVLYCSFFNLMNCPVGSRGRIFQPEYGSSILWFLQQPIDDSVAQQIRMSIMQTFNRWEPRIELDYSNTNIVPDYTLPGYRIRLSGMFKLSKKYISVDFTLKQQ